MGKGLRILTMCAVLAAAPAWGAEAAPPPGASAQDLLQRLEQDSAELQAAQHDAASAQARAEASGALPDPSVRIEWWDIPRNNPTLDPRQDGMTMYKLIQPIPGWGKRDAQKQAAEADASVARQRQRAVRAGLRTEVKLAFARYYRAWHALQLNQELSSFADTVAQLAQSRYETGLASQQEMIRAQLEQSGLQTERYALQAEYAQSQARINALLNRPARAELQPPAMLRPLPPPAALDEQTLEQRLRESSPELAGETAQIASAEGNADLTRRNQSPDFTVGLGPTQRGSSFSTFGAMLEFTVPLHTESHHAHQREAAEALDASRARRQAAEARLLGELRERFAALQAAQQQEALDSQRALPLAELAFKGALAGYRNGNVDFATLLEARRQVQKTELDELDAQVAAQVNLAGIEQLIGEDL
jgi:cobalt-zinc-cadmium efflux system outer membrane protein